MLKGIDLIVNVIEVAIGVAIVLIPICIILIKKINDIEDNFYTQISELMPKFSEHLFNMLKGSIYGTISGNVRGQKAVESAITTDILDQSGIGGLLDMVPTLKKLVKRNPRLLEMGLSMLSGFGGGQGGGGPTSIPYQPERQGEVPSV